MATGVAGFRGEKPRIIISCKPQFSMRRSLRRRDLSYVVVAIARMAMVSCHMGSEVGCVPLRRSPWVTLPVRWRQEMWTSDNSAGWSRQAGPHEMHKVMAPLPAMPPRATLCERAKRRSRGNRRGIRMPHLGKCPKNRWLVPPAGWEFPAGICAPRRNRSFYEGSS